MNLLPYDETDPKSIEDYSQNLIGKSFAEILANNTNNSIIKESQREYGQAHENKNRKGGLGELIEECFFHYKCNNDSKPDFDKAGVELKVTPYKINKNGSLSAKERLIISMIDYCNDINEPFYDSHLRKKSTLILLIYYLYKKENKNRLDYKIHYAKIFSPPEEDLRIIEQDYNTIITKIRDGKAHELSEGDTIYLGAATKASTSSDRRNQPFSNIKAKPRAFAFKNSYMTYILNNYIVPGKSTYEAIIKNPATLNNTTFETYILEKINQYVGLSDQELCKIFDRAYNNNKCQWIDLAYRMLGIKSNKAEEFEKANIIVKAIRINENNKMRESMSFPSFKFKELIAQEWEDSDLYNYFDQTKFLFVVFKEQGNNYLLKGCQLWNMPFNDLNSTVFEGWINIKNRIKDGIKFDVKYQKNKKIITNNLPKKNDNPIVHIRPHAQKSAFKFTDPYIISILSTDTIGNLFRDANELPDGQWMTTQSFWINNSYILSQLTSQFFE